MIRRSGLAAHPTLDDPDGPLFRAQFLSPHEPQPGPHLVNGAHLVVDHPGRQNHLPEHILRKVGRHPGSPLWPGYPQAACREDAFAEVWQPVFEFRARRRKKDNHVCVACRCVVPGKGDVIRQALEFVFESTGRLDQDDATTRFDAQLLREGSARISRQVSIPTCTDAGCGLRRLSSPGDLDYRRVSRAD